MSFNNGNKTKTISKTDQSRETAVCGHFHKSAFLLASIPEPKGRLLVSIYTRHPIVFASLTLNSTVFPSNSTKNDRQTEKVRYSSLWSELLRSVLESILKDLHFEGLLCLRRERVKTSLNSLSFVFTAFCCVSVAFSYRNTPW